MRDFQRPASASVEAFLLPDDDPRLQTIKIDSTKPSQTVRREVDWTVCNGRHQDYRENTVDQPKSISEETRKDSLRYIAMHVFLLDEKYNPT